ncbi:MAG: hypothetical protein Fur0012_02330 [Elusimicrobiota bacterium]
MRKFAYNRVIARTLISYAVFAGLWILLSDKILGGIPVSEDTRVRWSIYKGWAFVLVTTMLLAGKLKRELMEKQKAEEKAMELELSKARAEEADRLKSAFLAVMSHELRTPLNSIIGFTGILLKELPGPLTDEQRKQLEMVQTSSRHLLSLINDVLDISRIEAGQMELFLEETDLIACIIKSAEIIKPLAEKKGLSLFVDIPKESVKSFTDRRRFEQVLINLLNNAVKFTEKGEVKLSAVRSEKGLSISVSDTGIGIKEEDMEKLFSPFSQIDTGTDRSHEGSGLGLSICKKLAILLGGEISAESHYAKGSIFRFFIPIKENR